jgi:hypothetical protein
MSVDGENNSEQTPLPSAPPEVDDNLEINGPYASFRVLRRDPQYELEIMMYVYGEKLLDGTKRRGEGTSGVKKVSFLTQ